MTRQEYNRKIVSILKDKYPKYKTYDLILDYINAAPQQRFGQIICNYIYRDYRDMYPSDKTKDFMSIVFPNNPDPFFEESKETYERLSTR